MEITLSAYSYEHILRYYNEVKTDGLKEHGFPRLAANMGILIAHKRRLDLMEIFIKMMDLCLQEFPKGKAANDFSIKEVIFALEELENANSIKREKMEEWKDLLRAIDPYKCYDVYAKSKEDIVYNWAAFTMLSEFMRAKMGLADSYTDFIDLQAFSQLRHLDENKMYRDPNNPMVYDLVTRGLFALLLHEGYEGEYKKEWQDALDATLMPTLSMQSVTGEMPYGGRSNQFIHNEAHCALMLEYYATLSAKRGDMALAGRCKAGVLRALENIRHHLSLTPIFHVKNRFPLATGYGCEDYAYFDKYMITAASFLYVAYRMCDEKIVPIFPDDRKGSFWQTSDDFHKVFLRGGDYFAEYDYKADTHYDCSGLGRLHKKGIPSELCLSTPCPHASRYKVDIEDPFPLAIVPGVPVEGKWLYGTEKEVIHTIKALSAEGESSLMEVEYLFPSGEKLEARYLLNGNGMQIKIKASSPVRCLLPAFQFNGEEETKITSGKNHLEVHFKGFFCRYETEEGTIQKLDGSARNRNGHYGVFAAEGNGELTILISLEKEG